MKIEALTNSQDLRNSIISLAVLLLLVNTIALELKVSGFLKKAVRS